MILVSFVDTALLTGYWGLIIQCYSSSILEREEDQSFENINYAVFGLGNKTYENYNTMGKYFDKRLSQLGGSRLLDLGLGDDDGK